MSRQSAVNCTLSKLTFRPDDSNVLESMIVVTFVDIYATLLVSTLLLKIQSINDNTPPLTRNCAKYPFYKSNYFVLGNI